MSGSEATPGTTTSRWRVVGMSCEHCVAAVSEELGSLPGVTSVDVDPRCTVADPGLFSHRRGAPTGRLASLVWME